MDDASQIPDADGTAMAEDVAHTEAAAWRAVGYSPPDLFDVALPPCCIRVAPFERHEWPIFFGRERMTDDVIDRLIAQQFVVLHGDSGCGKSLLIRAGVLARLEQEHAAAVCRAHLRHAAGQCASPVDVRVAGDARTGSRRSRAWSRFDARSTRRRRAPDASRASAPRGDADHICILVDQFEELLALARQEGPEEPTLLVRLLVSLLERRTPGLYAIVTMRSEFLGTCAQFAVRPKRSTARNTCCRA
jgi:hypothetical protein